MKEDFTMIHAVNRFGSTVLAIGLLVAGAASASAQGLLPRRQLGSRLQRPAACAAQGQQKGASDVAAKLGGIGYVPGLQQGVFEKLAPQYWKDRNFNTILSCGKTCADADRYSHAYGTILADVDVISHETKNEQMGTVEKFDENAAVLYEGEIYIEEGKEYSFFVAVDDWASIEIGGEQILNGGYQEVCAGDRWKVGSRLIASKKFEKSGWRPIRVWLCDICGGGAPMLGFGGMGIGWNAEGCKELNAATFSKWHPLRDDGSGRFLRSKPMPQKAESGNGSLGAGSLRGRRSQSLRSVQSAGRDAEEQADALGEAKKETVDGYTWSYRVKNGEAAIMAENDGKHTCAVSPNPTAHIAIPSELGGARVTRIGRGAFLNARELASATIPEGVTSIDLSAFYGCRALVWAEIPNTVTNIGVCAFAYCTKLARVTIPESVTEIGHSAFCGCGSLTSVEIPNSVRNIGGGAFYDCGWLKSFVVDPRNAHYKSEGGMILTKDGKTLVAGINGDVKIPDGVTTVGFHAFCNLHVKSLTLPDGLAHIGKGAFSGCRGLEFVTIPASVKGIGSEAFRICRDLTSVTMCGVLPKLEADVFAKCENLKEIHVPANSKSWAKMKDLQGFPLVFDGPELSQSELAREARLIEREAEEKARKEGERVQREAELAEQRRKLAAIQAELKEVRRAKAAAGGGGGAKNEVQELTLGAADGLPCELTMVGLPGNDKVAPFAIGKYEITQEQYGKVMGENPSTMKGPKLPVNNVTWEEAMKFCERLNTLVKRPGLKWALPKPDQFYYAEKGGEKYKYPGSDDINEVAWTTDNSGGKLHPVGGKKPNGFGLYDMCGNVMEWGEVERSVFIGTWANSNTESYTALGGSVDDDSERRKSLGFRVVVVDTCADQSKNAKEPKDADTSSTAQEPSVLTGPYGLRIEADPGCAKGAEYILKRLEDVFLPCALRYYGDPFGGRKPTRVFTLHVKRNGVSGNRPSYTGASWGSCEDGINRFTIGLSKGSDKWEMDLPLVASKILTVCTESDGAAFSIYANDFIRGEIGQYDPISKMKADIREGLRLRSESEDKVKGRPWVLRKLAPTWAAFEELREKHPTLVLDYCNLKNSKYAKGELPQQISADQMVALMGEVTGVDAAAIFKKHNVDGVSSTPRGNISVPEKLNQCDFLLNKDFKKSAKFYLCLFSASWCPPCRAEMPRIAKTYAETLKDDPDMELIHFSRDQNDEKALAWAKEHDVKFPVVKPNGGNPLELRCNGIPHLFIVKADGTLLEEGHPMRIFNADKFREIKSGNVKPRTADGDLKSGERTELVGGYTWTYRVENGGATIVAAGGKRRCTISPSPKGNLTIPSKLGGMNVTKIGSEAFCGCSGITTVTFPASVKEVCWRAFSECGSLTSVSIPSGVAKIYSSAFSGCKSLTAITVSDENTLYASRDGILFDKDMKKLLCYPAGIRGDYVIPSGVTEIGDSAFSGCGGLTSVIVPDSVTRIGEFAFSQSRELASVVLGSGVERIGQAPFYWCSGLTSIKVSDANEHYASRDGVLFGKDMKTVVCCPGGLSGEYDIPAGVTTIGRYAFDSCRKLTAVTIPSSVTKIDYHGFNYCDGLTSIVIPASVKSIGDYAFDCRGLKSVTISEGVESIGTGTFCACFELSSVKIPSSVKKIGKYAFASCKKMTSVVMCGERPEIGEKAFDRSDSLKSIHVPANVTSWAGMKEWQGIPLVFDAEKSKAM